MMRLLLGRLILELKELELQIAEIDAMIAGKADDHEACQRLMAIPGIGPITATAIVSAVGNGAEFRKGRSFSAWLGLTPAEYSTGGKQKLLGISKRGNGYLRKLLVHGARAVLQFRDKQSPGLRAWLGQLVSRAHRNVVTIALAYKMARMAWALLAKGETYRPPSVANNMALAASQPVA
jgi:transposase